jgi:molybdate transport system regulatory protein
VSKPRTHVRVDFSEGSSVGPGKIGLLETIASTGSLSAAARELGMSYRRAWLLLHSVNAGFEEPVADLSTGGVDGGGARLTAFGEKLVKDYREFQRRVDALAQKSFGGIQASGTPPAEPAAPRRAISRSVAGTKRRR